MRNTLILSLSFAALTSAATAHAAPAKAKPTAPTERPKREGKLTYKDQRDYDLLPTRIEALDAQVARDEAALHDPALYARDPAKFATLTAAVEAAQAEKAAAEERWLGLAELVEG